MAENITIGKIDDIEPDGLFPKKVSGLLGKEDHDQPDDNDEPLEDDEQELDDDQEELYDDEEDDRETDSEDDGGMSEVELLKEQNARLMQSISDRDIHQKGIEQTLQEQINKLNEKLEGATDQSVVEGKDPDDYSKYGDIRALEEKVNMLAGALNKVTIEGNHAPVSSPPDPEAQWVDMQPDKAEVNAYITKNHAKLNANPNILSAKGQMAQYYAVKAEMLQEKLNESGKRDKSRKKNSEARRKAGKLPETGGMGKRTGSRKKSGTQDATDRAFNMPHNRVIDL